MLDYRFHHGNTVDEREVRVVLLLRLPGVTRGRTDVATPASLIDVAPTVLDYLRVPPPPGVAFDGKSLLPAVRGADAEARIGFAYTNPARGPWTCARDARWKLVRDARDGSARLFDHAADPDGATDRAAERSSDRERLGAALSAWDDGRRAAIALRPPTSFEYDAKTVEMLRALGYLPPAEAPKK
jgi:arylsulfatase A-like enzyme